MAHCALVALSCERGCGWGCCPMCCPGQSRPSGHSSRPSGHCITGTNLQYCSLYSSKRTFLANGLLRSASGALGRQQGCGTAGRLEYCRLQSRASLCLAMSVPTASGCFCAEVTHDYSNGASAAWAGCGEQGWCDVAPGCETAMESGPTYAGWDACTSAIPDALRPGSSGLMGEPGIALVAAGAVAACALHWLSNRIAPSQAPPQDPLLEETPCKFGATANVRAQARMPFQSPTLVQQCLGDTGSASKIPIRRLSEALTPRHLVQQCLGDTGSASKIPVRRLSEALTPRQTNVTTEMSATKRGVQSEKVFCPKNALPRTPARGLAGLATSPSSANQQLRFENKNDWLSHHDEGLQLTADYSGGSVPLPTDLDDSVVAPEETAETEGEDAGMVSSPSSIDSDAPSSPGEEQNGTTEPHVATSASGTAAPSTTWESMAADAGIPLADLEAFGKMNAKDLIKQIGSLSTKGAAAVAAFETSHKDRKTVQLAVARKIETATGAEE